MKKYNQGGSKIKTRPFILIFILVLAVLVIAGSCATKKKMVKKSEELLGTWANEAYERIYGAVVVYKPDGTWDLHTDMSHTSLQTSGTFIIDDKWTDPQNNIFYKVKLNYKIGTQELIDFCLIKLSDSGNTYEIIYDRREYPDEINPIAPTYFIRYRQ